MTIQFHKLIYQKQCTRKECGKSVHCEMKHFLIAPTRIHTNLGEKLKRLFGRPRHRWANIKINVKEVARENVNRIDLPQYEA